MTHRAEYAFDARFVAAAMRRDFLWRGYLIAAVVACVPVYFRWSSGAWDTGALAFYLGLAAIVIVLFHGLLRMSARNQVKLWRTQSPDGRIQFIFDAEGFEAVVGASRNRFAWKNLRRVWRYPDVWMFEIVKMRSVFLPPDCLSEEQRRDISAWCAQAGVRVKP